MGSGESVTRKVSFGVDEADRVRILRGVKLSDDVLQRMRNANQVSTNQIPVPKVPVPAPPSPPPIMPSAPPTVQKDPGPPLDLPPQPETLPPPPVQPLPQPQPLPQTQPEAQPAPQPSPQPPPTPTPTTEEPKKSYEWQQSVLKEELTKVVRREREAAVREMNRALQKERQISRQDTKTAEKLVQQLKRKDAELKALDAFYKEQIAQLEKRNQERYLQAGEKFHDAAAQAETHVRYRCTEGVCAGLQSQILSCYRDNREQTLLCSDLAKQYMQCITAAKKNLLVGH